MKISQALWWDVKREPGNPLVSRIVRASSNGIVIARNPIYQAFPRPSSILCTAFHRFSLCHFSRFSKPGRRRHWQLSSPCLGLLQCRVVYVSPVPKTAISDRVDFSPVWCDSYYRPAFLSSLFLSWQVKHDSWGIYISLYTELLHAAAIAVSMDNSDLSPRWTWTRTTAVIFHVPISLIRRTVIALFIATHYLISVPVSAYRCGKYRQAGWVT